MKKLQTFLFLALAATSFVACSSDDEDAQQQPSQPKYPLTISVSETPYVNPDDADASRGTRGEIRTTESTSFKSFKMDYVYGSSSHGFATATREEKSKSWSSTGSWPDTDIDTKVDWYAYTDGSFIIDENTGKPYISFTVDENVEKQKDLLVAKASAKYSECKGTLSFKFDHACAALRFYMKKAKNLRDYTLTVSEVKLCNVVKSGDYNFNGSWSRNETEISSYTLFAGSMQFNQGTTTEFTALESDNSKAYLFLIPQTLTAWSGTDSPANTYLKLTCVLKNGETEKYNGEAYIPFGYAIAKGVQYDVKVNVGKTSLRNNDGSQIIQ